jgi:hypothetical protein
MNERSKDIYCFGHSIRGVVRLVIWEYKVLPVKTRVHSYSSAADRKPVIENIQDKLNVLGKDGWELVSVQNIRLEDGRLFTVAYLKRQEQ